MASKPTDYERFEQESVRTRRLLRQEELILDVTENICEASERGAVTRTELARRLGRTKGFISQLLGGGRNLTLRTIADVADALGYVVQFRMASQVPARVVHREILPHFPERPDAWTLKLSEIRREHTTAVHTETAGVA
jgi:transcriptional regulator with XRE-family HTH domain